MTALGKIGGWALLRLAVAALLVIVSTLFWATWMQPDLSPIHPGADPSNAISKSGKMEMSEQQTASQVRFPEPDSASLIFQEVDYSEGPNARWWPKGESPVLRALVEASELPPVAKRVGPEPAVLQGVEGIGHYGGVWSKSVVWDADQVWDEMNRYTGAVTLVRWSPSGYPIVPHVAKSWQVSDDLSQWTFQLRKGMKWSDGHLFTAHDIGFWYRYEYLYGREEEAFIDPDGDRVIRIGSHFGAVEVLDDYTVRFVFPVPNPFFLEILAGTPVKFLFAPRHYLEKFHPELGDKTLIDEIMERRGFTLKHQVYLEIKREDNPELPAITPWIIRRFKTNPPHSFVRNPYYWAVDSEGNQLPYIDQVTVEVQGPDIYSIDAASGGFPVVFNLLDFTDYALYASGQETYGYRLRHYYPGSRGSFVIWPNINRRIDPDNPATRLKRELLNRKEFRQAISLAINRRAIINAEFHGVGEPAQVAPPPESPFHLSMLVPAFTDHDPERANSLLDQAGLIYRDDGGFRTTKERIPLVWYLSIRGNSAFGAIQFVIDDWREVGIRAVPKPISTGLFVMEKVTRQYDLIAGSSYTEFIPVVEPKAYVPVDAYCMFAPAYGSWYSSTVRSGPEVNLDRRGEPPPSDHPISEVFALYQSAMQAPSREEGFEQFKQILRLAAENIWTINISTPAPVLAIVRNDFRNVPTHGISAPLFRTPSHFGVETFFFAEPTVSTGTRERIALDIRGEQARFDPIAMAHSGSEQGTPSVQKQVRRLLSTLVWLIVVFTIVLLGFKHPYVGRRLLLFIPMLIVISAMTFVIIKIPPGNIIETRLLNLEETGTAASRQEIERIRQQFRLDDPLLMQYARWLGLPWFLSFSEGDRGLLQGNLGVSLDDPRRPQPVNQIVGDRILLTFLISLGTILFTWALALPVGVYSAVRQYSASDYLLTFLGFVGMSVPNFLLALLVIYWTGKYLGVNLTGLFSPEYETHVEWSWGKVVDLLKHIWVPLVVLGVGGTASMIRVMRGNLLDELRKPYVTTALAKGVRPIKLLVKYPVRIAINPFISTIGTIFPQLVSGGAIVAVVLGLPTVGPLLLQALMNEDIYLAGSMLVVLSFLGIIGTLVSDLLLMWLDPRIRMGAGQR